MAKTISIPVKLTKAEAQIPLNENDFSPRAYKRLVGSGILTMGDLVQNYEKLDGISAFGKGCKKEVNNYIVKFQQEKFGEEYFHMIYNANITKLAALE